MRTLWNARIRKWSDLLPRLWLRTPLWVPLVVWPVRVGENTDTYCVIALRNPHRYNGPVERAMQRRTLKRLADGWVDDRLLPLD